MWPLKTSFYEKFQYAKNGSFNEGVTSKMIEKK